MNSIFTDTPGECQIRVYYLRADGTDGQMIIHTHEQDCCNPRRHKLIRAAVNAYFAVLGDYEVLSVQLEFISASSFDAEDHQVLAFPHKRLEEFS
jgi:hypothetical protein